MRRKVFYPVFWGSIAAAFLLAVGLFLFSEYHTHRVAHIEEADETNSSVLHTVQTAEGETLFQTTWPVEGGDRFCSRENQWYQLENPNDGLALAKPIPTPQEFSFLSLPQSENPPFLTSRLVGANGEEREVHVVIYHTHSDESYGYGTDIVSEPGNGDVYEVGERLSADLRTAGASVTHSYATHDPHDASAYQRSRITLLSLLPEQPDLVIDLHRDSAPLESYVTTINGQLAARVMLVVGAANPTMETNLRYAYALKEIADEVYPDLMRGIYIGKGSYNQDLYPSAMLMEFGTDGMSRDTAEKSASCISDILQRFLLEALPYLAASTS